MVNTSRNFSDDYDPRFAVRDSSMTKLKTAILITEEPSPEKGRMSVSTVKKSPSPISASARAKSHLEVSQ